MILTRATTVADAVRLALRHDVPDHWRNYLMPDIETGYIRNDIVNDDFRAKHEAREVTSRLKYYGKAGYV